MSALTRLAEKVEAGDRIGATELIDGLPNGGKHWSLALAAHRGSLDAAMALHEAVLPGWVWTVCCDYASVSNTDGVNWRTNGHYSAFNAIPARAWLLAILRALVSTEPH